MKERFMLDPSKLDTNSGFLCLSTHWRPDPNASNPDMPGQKLVMTSYIPVRADDVCLCGSGKTFDACCRQQHHRREAIILSSRYTSRVSAGGKKSYGLASCHSGQRPIRVLA